MVVRERGTAGPDNVKLGSPPDRSLRGKAQSKVGMSGGGFDQTLHSEC